MTSILIVEDDITYGMMLKTWLGKKGFQVTSASSIARAQKHIESETVDLILSDLRLPDKDGIDLLKWLGEHGLQIPLIIMTGYADIQSAVQAMKLGACDYIAKPVNPETYDPTPQQLVDLAQSKAYFRIGYIGFEQTWTEKLTDNAPHLQFFDMSENVELILDDTHAHHHKDGHVHEGHTHAGLQK